MLFIFGLRKFLGGSIHAHVLILSCVRLLLIWGVGPKGENVARKLLEFEFPFPLGVKKTFPMCLNDGNSATTTAHALVTGDLVHLH